MESVLKATTKRKLEVGKRHYWLEAECRRALRRMRANYAFKPTADRALRSNQLPRRGGLMRR